MDSVANCFVIALVISNRLISLFRDWGNIDKETNWQDFFCLHDVDKL